MRELHTSFGKSPLRRVLEKILKQVRWDPSAAQFMVNPPLSGEVWSESPALVSLWSVTLSGEGRCEEDPSAAQFMVSPLPSGGLWSTYFMELNRASIEYHLFSEESPPQTTCLSRDWIQLWGYTTLCGCLKVTCAGAGGHVCTHLGWLQGTVYFNSSSYSPRWPCA